MTTGRVRAQVRSGEPGVVGLVGLEHLGTVDDPPFGTDPAVEAAEGTARRAGPAEGLDSAAKAVLEVVDAAFAAGHHRVEAEVPREQVALRRVLQRAGLRPEGVARGRGRGADGIPVDVLRLARLRDDPPPGTHEAFLAMLDASLPTKRLIVQGLVTDGAGRVLLCELTYKKDWDLVGGVAEPAESPVASLRREVSEELGLELPIGGLVAVDWLPPYKQWTDALLLVFDLGAHPDLIERVTLQPTELRAVHWSTTEEAAGHVAPYVARLLTSVLARDPGGPTLFLEDGLPRKRPGGASA
ncbi:NUDIX hydrolase [Ornithinimicrobium avium]|uniref:NUDIX hydrolase n=1 Tax=Ornithinimicrobium avium TaxID=2283195 RepID=A0A345NPS4_9MICO|nr:NUDIX hydrolase [Ornithinimicrobium avium]AXH97032.1 NUDIX hydrolase [Ornithinimicrobium avium]